MRPRLYRNVRRSIALAAMAVYAVPLCLAWLTDAAHTAGHVAEWFESQHRMAVAMGLNHGEGGVDDRVVPARPLANLPGEGSIVHRHGGATHGHGAAVSTLLAAAESSDALDQGEQTAPTGGAPHLPVSRLAMRETPLPPSAPAPEDRPHPAASSLLPPVPPPRA